MNTMHEIEIQRRERERRELEQQLRQLRVGERFGIEARVLADLYPNKGFDNMPLEDRFLETRMGANFGAWTCRIVGDMAVIGRHEEGEHRVRVDWDRR